MRLRIELFVLVVVLLLYVVVSQKCTQHNDCPDTNANRHCCKGQCGNCPIRCRKSDDCLNKYNDVCCFKPDTNRGWCMKNPYGTGSDVCPFSDLETTSVPEIPTNPPTTIPTQPPTTQPPSTQPPTTAQPTTIVPSTVTVILTPSAAPYENRCFVSGQCLLPNYVCCWDIGRRNGHCVPKEQAPIDCLDMTVTDAPGHQRCFNSDQCKQINEPPNCCPKSGEQWGYCKNQCDDPLPETRCFVDKMCTTPNAVCCWRPNDIHGNCFKRESAPNDCQQSPKSPQPGAYWCYNSLQCDVYDLSQPQKCCYVIGETPGLCQSSCDGSPTQPPIDPRCFVDKMCGDPNVICCWKKNQVHGQCTPKNQAPEDCGLYIPATTRPNQMDCYVDLQCKMAYSKAHCCGTNGDVIGQCADKCNTTEPAIDPRCFVDKMCGDPNVICCWKKNSIHGQCTPKNQAPDDCGLYIPATTRPNQMDCYSDGQCQVAYGKAHCCNSVGEKPGSCQDSCDQPPSTIDPRCFVDVMCNNPDQVCCWTEGAIHGQCTPKSQAPNDCGKYTRTPPPGVASMCYVDEQCRLVGAPSKCCYAVEETPGFCQHSCNQQLSTTPYVPVDPRCFVDAMCGDLNRVCCWTEGAIHGQCTPKSSAPSDCGKYTRTPPPGVASMCYVDRQCQLVGAPPKCCFAVGETPGFCQADCAPTQAPVDPRCFVDAMCNNPDQVCCWSEGSIHGQCTPKAQQPADCKRYMPPTTRPNQMDCYIDGQCQVAYKKAHCCGGSNERIGQCADTCQPIVPIDQRCFVDAMCNNPDQVCCWTEGAIHGQCTPKSSAPSDCGKYTRTPPPGVASMCYVDRQCQLVGAPPKCCFAVGETPGFCQNTCDQTTTLVPGPNVDSRCFDDRMCADSNKVCCWSEGSIHGQCTPKSQQPNDCKKYAQTPPPGIASFCYQNLQCQLVNAPPNCCFAIGESLGVCQKDCSATQSPSAPPVDPRCFADAMCGDQNTVCCWSEGSTHGQCTPKSNAPADCKKYSQTPPPDVSSYCYQNLQCQLINAPPNCCFAIGESLGSCQKDCTQSPGSSVDPRCFVDAMCDDSNKVCCWTQGAIHGQCTPKSQQPADCKKYSQTPPPGIASFCYQNLQCQLINAPPNCCFAIGESLGSCQKDCSAAQSTSTADPRCFVDAMCEDNNMVCCWTEGAVHGQCTPKFQAPNDCGKYTRTPLPGVASMCYVDQQCKAVNAPPKCCFAIGETPGFCQNDCAATQQPSVDPRCFVDAMCGDKNTVCCWSEGSIHGQCTLKAQKPSNCKEYKKPMKPGITYCYTGQQCQLVGAKPLCCDVDGESFGHCGQDCTTGEKCFYDRACDYPGEICCWHPSRSWGYCLFENRKTDDCDAGKVTDAPGKTRCFEDKQCQRMNQPPKCCKSKVDPWGFCQSNCDAAQPPSSDDPRCFVDKMCKDPRLVCCWTQGSVHGMCTPKEQAPTDCDKYMRTPPPEIGAFCYTDQHCRFVGVASKCCYAINETPGYCQNTCDTTVKPVKTTRKPQEPSTTRLPPHETPKPATETPTNASCECKSILNATRLYRSYNYGLTDHFYTISASESQTAVGIGWLQEDPMGYVGTREDPKCPKFTQLYRLYSRLLSNHIYTVDKSERADLLSSGYTAEYNAGYCSTEPGCGMLPLFRLWHAGFHDSFYTINEEEKESAIGKGYSFQRIECYVYFKL
ncbi:hypothetical protein M3Y95_01240100 [Aphelenchoides besseyi]|nr:hypothetical protein M3Y95_01240100 [Aphelenchoides besseyi]